MIKPDLHRKAMDELPLSQLGWEWLSAAGRADKANKVVRPEFETNGGLVSAWRDNELTCYFVVIRDSYNWCDLHCQIVGSAPQPGLEVTDHANAEDAVAIGRQWLTSRLADYSNPQIDVNPSADGAIIISAWLTSRRLQFYVAVIPSPSARYTLIRKTLPESYPKFEGCF